MKYLITFIFLSSALLSVGQTKKKIERETLREDTYVKTAYPDAVKFCGVQPTTLYLTNKRIIFTSPEVSFDIKIFKRRKSVWYGRDNGITYQVRSLMRGDSPVLMFIPERGSQKLGVMISRTSICD